MTSEPSETQLASSKVTYSAQYSLPSSQQAHRRCYNVETTSVTSKQTMMSTWRMISPAVTTFVFFSKNDINMTGRSVRARGSILTLNMLTALQQLSRPCCWGESIQSHFSRFRIEIHTGTLEPRGSINQSINQSIKRLFNTTILSSIKL